MTDLPTARRLIRAADPAAAADPADVVDLDYEGRILRRRRLTTRRGESLMVDLAETASVDEGDCFVLDDGRQIVVHAAAEPVLTVTGDLARLAWHIGNRHTPCQIGADRLVIRDDHVIAAMLDQLGAGISRGVAPFRPEGGAYGHGRTMGHDHGRVHHHGSHHGKDDDTDDGVDDGDTGR